MLENFIDSFRLDVSMDKGAFPFELVSSPLDNNVDDLLEGDQLTGEETNESLLSRMKRIEAFIGECLKTEGVLKVELNINVEFHELDNFKQYNILSEDFAGLMLGLFRKSHNSTPRVRFLFEEE